MSESNDTIKNNGNNIIIAKKDKTISKNLLVNFSYKLFFISLT